MSQKSLKADEINCPVRKTETQRNSLVQSSHLVRLILPLDFVRTEGLSIADQ